MQRCGLRAVRLARFETVEARPRPAAWQPPLSSTRLAVSVTWDAVDDATSYKLQWRRSDAQSFDASNATTVTGNTASITVSGYGEWVVQAQACSDAGCGPFASHESRRRISPGADWPDRL